MLPLCICRTTERKIGLCNFGQREKDDGLHQQSPQFTFTSIGPDILILQVFYLGVCSELL